MFLGNSKEILQSVLICYTENIDLGGGDCYNLSIVIHVKDGAGMIRQTCAACLKKYKYGGTNDESKRCIITDFEYSV